MTKASTAVRGGCDSCRCFRQLRPQARDDTAEVVGAGPAFGAHDNGTRAPAAVCRHVLSREPHWHDTGGAAGMERHVWSRLNHLQIGRYAEYFTKLEFTMYGFDVYGAEVDDRGIDFVIRKGVDRYYDVQVKSQRMGKGRASPYIFMRKSQFEPRETLLLAVVLFEDGEVPRLYLIPSTEWLVHNPLFVSRDYGEGRKSPPEWGLSITRGNLQSLEEYRFETTVGRL